MSLLARMLGGALLLIILILVVGPFLIPIPPLEGVVPNTHLADKDSRFIEVSGLSLHARIAGQGAPLIILLHGFGANTESWRKVMQPLAQHGTVVAYDRPGFGLTERPLDEALRSWPGANPYSPEAQADQVVALIQALGFEQAVLVGNSAGGTVALYAYLRHPERVQGLVFVDAAIYTGGGAPGWIKPLLGTPQFRRLGPLVSRSLSAQGDRLLALAWHDPAKITPEDIAAYRRATRVENWDRALWEFTLASRDLHLAERVAEVRIPALVITGDDDRIVPTGESIRLARELSDAELVVIPACGHVPQEECPEAFVDALRPFLSHF
ncbi:MAG: alpha/beta fold hydrolase [Anaerolineae bacterium]